MTLGPSQVCGFCHCLCPGRQGVGFTVRMVSSFPSPLTPGLGVRTWPPQVSSVFTDTLCYPGSFCRALHVAGAPWRSKPLPSTCPGPHACCTCPSPTPSPDGLCQAISAASLTPQQLLGPGCARTQLARVPPSLGAAGMLRGTGGGWGGPSMETYVLSPCEVGLPRAQRTGSWRRGAQDRRAPLSQF